MQTRIRLPEDIYQYIAGTRVKLNRAERSAVQWARIDDYQAVLEVSCEREHLINYYQSQYHLRACGLCFDIELARQLRSSLENAEIMSSINGDIPWKNDSFNRIIMTNILPHYLCINDFLTEIYRVLAPGGKLVFTLPIINNNNFLFSLKTNMFDWKPLLQQLEKAGFEDVFCNKTRFVERCLIAHKHS